MRDSIILLLLSVIVLSPACSNKRSGQEDFEGYFEADTLSTEIWSVADISELVLNPVENFSRNWMALSTGSLKSFNAMTISWGQIGQLWNKPVVTVFVCQDRYTKTLMDKNKYFTVTGFPQTRDCRRSLEYLGSHSQRDDPDKIVHSGFTPRFTKLGNPIFEDGIFALECRILYKQEFDSNRIPADIVEKMYSNSGMHTMYIGEIVNYWRKYVPVEMDSEEAL